MNTVFARIRQRGSGCKYRKVLSTPESIYPDKETCIASSSPYTPGANLDTGEWFYINNASTQEFSIDLLQETIATVDFDNLPRNNSKKINYIFSPVNNDIYFQNVPQSRLIEKRCILAMGDDYAFNPKCFEIVINDYPDAIFEKSTDTLYFRKLESITSIFKGIDQLYREATDAEVTSFLAQDFITLNEDYSFLSVKTANRRRIALAQNTLSNLNPDDKNRIFSYIRGYCPSIVRNDNTFGIGSEDELKQLLFGIEQRYYTTLVGEEQRLANSVIRL